MDTTQFKVKCPPRWSAHHTPKPFQSYQQKIKSMLYEQQTADGAIVSALQDVLFTILNFLLC